jgi:hypothetical protein
MGSSAARRELPSNVTSVIHPTMFDAARTHSTKGGRLHAILFVVKMSTVAAAIWSICQRLLQLAATIRIIPRY